MHDVDDIDCASLSRVEHALDMLGDSHETDCLIEASAGRDELTHNESYDMFSISL